MSDLITHNAKAVIALIMSALALLDQIFGISFPGVSEAWVTSVIVLLTPLFVWWVPNRG